MMEVPYHYQFRIIMIGDTMAGKSSLLKTFYEGTFADSEPTVGVDFFSKIIQIKPKNNHHQAHSHQVNNHNRQHNHHHKTNHDSLSIADKTDDTIIVKLQLWDTAGQERFRSILTSYYRNSVGIILVYDVTNKESYDHLIDWFTEARRHVEPTPSPTLSPVTQTAPRFSSIKYPLTSTPNHTRTGQSNSRLENSNESSSSSLNASNSGDNSTLSFNSLSAGQKRDNNYKMVYLVLGCKTDLESQREVSFEDGKAFADMYGFKFIETSSKMNYNVNRAFQVIAEEIYEKINSCSRSNRLHRTPSGSHLTFDGTSSPLSEGIRIGPLIENNLKRYYNRDRVNLLEAQPVSGFLGGCC